MFPLRWASVAVLLAVMVGLAAYTGLLQPFWNPPHRFNTTQNAVGNGDFSDPSGIAYINGFSLGPVYFCPSPLGSPSPINHKWGMLHAENDIMLGNRSRAIYGVSTVDSRNAFVAGMSPGEGGRISLLQLLGPTTVNSSTRIHFAIDSLNSTNQEFSSVILVLGSIWQKSNGSFTNGYVVVFHLDALPNSSGWYDFDFSLPNFMHELTGNDLTGSTFGGPCLSSRGIALGIETASVLEQGVFSPSPSLGMALTDVAVYDSPSGHDTMFNGRPFQYFVNGTALGSESHVSVTSYSVAFPVP
ncbi:MAG: hypothetical protein LYZ69_00510 [Nitrososphaerales archaeon]|nr:hypothetical protein [Nitrososphaerales archaeon]